MTTTSRSDPGEQERGRPRKRRPAAPLPVQPSIFDEPPPQPPRGPSEGDKRKEKAIEKHERSGRAPLIRFLRTHLVALYKERAFIARHIHDPVFVTADDAAWILRQRGIDLTDDDGNQIARNWFGALFKAKGWKFTGRTVPSLRPEANGRHVRCWRWEGK